MDKWSQRMVCGEGKEHKGDKAGLGSWVICASDGGRLNCTKE